LSTPGNSAGNTPPPLDLRELFAQPWSGSAELWRPWWLRWLPIPSSFRFRSEIVNLTDTGWDVRDTTTFPNGRIQVRTMHCSRIANGRLRLTADDMPGGAEVTPRHDGFDFSPYTIQTPILGPLRVALRFTDSVQLQRDQTMVDTIKLSYLAVHVGTVTMRLQRANA